jgi:hypothetical protein
MIAVLALKLFQVDEPTELVFRLVYLTSMFLSVVDPPVVSRPAIAALDVLDVLE